MNPGGRIASGSFSKIPRFETESVEKLAFNTPVSRELHKKEKREIAARIRKNKALARDYTPERKALSLSERSEKVLQNR